MSLRRLQNLVVKLQKSSDALETFHNIINHQIKEGMVKKVDKSIPPNMPGIYLPHKPVFRKNAENTKSLLFMMHLQERKINENY